MTYLDGFVLPVPKKKLDHYLTMARKAGEIWQEHGAVGYVESVADDVKEGKLTSFPQSVKLKKDEVVVFSFILFKSRADRDKVNQAVLGDPRIEEMMSPDAMSFDGKRMIYGGFDVRISLDGKKKKPAKKAAKTASKKKKR